MKRHTSRNTHRDEKFTPSRNEYSDTVLHARTEEEKRRRRREWLIEQDKIDRHNRLKRKMAMEYEIRRAHNMDLPLPQGRCNNPRRSRSESPPSRRGRISEHCTPKVTVLCRKFETLSGTTPLFKGPDGTRISPTELRIIKVDIRRNIPGRAATHKLKRDIPNKEDVVLKRRAVRNDLAYSSSERDSLSESTLISSRSVTAASEGSKPIFDREEIRGAISETEAVEEHRTVVAVNLGNSENKSRRHSRSLSPTRTQRHNPRPTSSRRSRYADSKHDDKGSCRTDREKDRSRERKDGDRSYQDHRERPRDHSRDRRKTDKYKESPRERRQSDRPREQMVPFPAYIEQIPVSIYYGNFQPKPLMGPWVPNRGPLGGNIRPPMMRPFGTLPPRFRPPLNPRFPQMF